MPKPQSARVTAPISTTFHGNRLAPPCSRRFLRSPKERSWAALSGQAPAPNRSLCRFFPCAFRPISLPSTRSFQLRHGYSFTRIKFSIAPQGYGGLFACQHIVDRKEAPGCILRAARSGVTAALRSAKEQFSRRIRTDRACAAERGRPHGIGKEPRCCHRLGDDFVGCCWPPRRTSVRTANLTPALAQATSGEAVAEFTAANCRRATRSQRNPGPNFAPRQSPLAAGDLGEEGSQKPHLRRTVLPTSCGCQVDNPTSCILRLRGQNPKSKHFKTRFPPPVGTLGL